MTISSTSSPVSANQPASYPLVPVPEMSRRTFIKLLGIAVAEVAIEFSPLRRITSTFTHIHTAHSAPPIPAAIGPLLRQAIEELREQGFPFDLEQASVVSTPERPHLVGMMLQDTRLPPRPDGANIMLTIDTQSPQRSTLSYVVGRSADSGLEVSSTSLPVGGERRQRSDLFPRAGRPVQRGPAMYTTSYAAHRAEAVSQLPGSATGSATWKEWTHWYYDRCGDAAWLGDRDSALRLHYSSCREYRNCRDCSIAPAGRSGGWYSEIHKVALEGM